MTGGPGWPQGPGGSWPPPAPQRPPRRWLLIAIPAVALVVAAAAVFIATRGTGDDRPKSSAAQPTTTAGPPPPPAVSMRVLPALLLPPDGAAHTIRATLLVGAAGPPDADKEWEKDKVFTTLTATPPIADQDCIGLSAPAEQSAYDGTGFEDLARQTLATPAGDKTYIQAVIGYADARDAANYVAGAKDAWQRCTNRTVDFSPADNPDAGQVFDVGELTDTDGIVTVSRTSSSGDGWTCLHAKAPRNNIVIDIQTCGHNMAPTVIPALIDEINDRIEASHQ
ncbi:sensor domain-containing protein [Mycobacterium hubeiense]|uniref:sensor domain-containing protein n=1 Tax=Mycobacterium hubeiense TaxID=1867256 RepID=UPI001159D01B|nr:sensor domain-containing protein [Mycobacterium sp. QGD 101]